MTTSASSHPARPDRSLTADERRAALVEMMKAHGEAVFGFCFRVMRDRTLAEDLTQQVFLEAHRDFVRFHERSSPRTWLFGIASHRCLDMLRSEQRRSQRFVCDDQAIEESSDPSPGPAEHLESSRLHAALDECLGLLSPEVRATVLMRFRSGLTYDELATPLQAAAAALQLRVARALLALRGCLERKGWTGD